MSGPPTATTSGQVRAVRSASARLWRAAWAVLAVVVTVVVVDYPTLLLSRFVPTTAWSVPGVGLALALAAVAVRADVVLARHTRGRRGTDVLALLVAGALVGVWLWLLWELLRDGCFDGSCDDVPVWKPLVVTLPVVPFAGLAVVGWLVRRGARADV